MAARLEEATCHTTLVAFRQANPPAAMAPAGAAVYKISSTLPTKLFLGDAVALSVLADRISDGLAEMRDRMAGCPCSGGLQGEETTTLLFPDGYIWPPDIRNFAMQIIVRS